MDLDEREIAADVIKLVPRDVCEKHTLIPVSLSGDSLMVAMSDPTNRKVIDDLEFLTAYKVEPAAADEAAILAAIERHYGSGPSRAAEKTCSYCGTIYLFGRAQVCPQCGAPPTRA